MEGGALWGNLEQHSKQQKRALFQHYVSRFGSSIAQYARIMYKKGIRAPAHGSNQVIIGNNITSDSQPCSKCLSQEDPGNVQTRPHIFGLGGVLGVDPRHCLCHCADNAGHVKT